MKKRSFSLERKRAFSGYIFVLPFVLGFLIFQIYPLFESFMLSIGKIDNMAGLQMHMIGLSNYVDIFTKDVAFVPDFLETLRITLVYTPFIVVISLVIALLLNQKIVGRSVFRVIFFLPVLLGTGLVMQQLGDAANIMKIPFAVERFINYYFSSDTVTTIQSFLDEMMQVFWKMGVQIIIFLGGLQAIPPSYYEAARVDNASTWDMLWKITLPMMSPMIYLNTIYTIISSFGDENNPIAGLIVSNVKNSHYEYGSAEGWLYFIVVFALIGLVSLIFRRSIYYEK